MESFQMFERLGQVNFQEPLRLEGFGEAWIDPEMSLASVDRLSQIHALIQARNLSRYQLISQALKEKRSLIHTLWYDLNTGELNYFSKKEKVI